LILSFLDRSLIVGEEGGGGSPSERFSSTPGVAPPGVLIEFAIERRDVERSDAVIELVVILAGRAATIQNLETVHRRIAV